MSRTAREVAIEFISVLGMPPAAFVELAAQLGCAHIGLAVTPLAPNPHNYPAWSLRNPGLTRDVAAALRDHGVSVSLGEGFLIRPSADIGDMAADMDILRELGAPRVNVVSIESDSGRGLEQCSRFAEMAAARDMEATLEFMPSLVIGDFSSALDAVRQVDRQNFRLLIDAMHFFRSGSRVADLAATAPDLIGYVQLCDVPLVARNPNYGEEARSERMAPGKGELPLAELVAALPPNLPVGIETPMLAQALAGVSSYERLAPCLDAARNLLT